MNTHKRNTHYNKEIIRYRVLQSAYRDNRICVELFRARTPAESGETGEYVRAAGMAAGYSSSATKLRRPHGARASRKAYLPLTVSAPHATPANSGSRTGSSG